MWIVRKALNVVLPAQWVILKVSPNTEHSLLNREHPSNDISCFIQSIYTLNPAYSVIYRIAAVGRSITTGATISLNGTTHLTPTSDNSETSTDHFQEGNAFLAALITFLSICLVTF